MCPFREKSFFGLRLIWGNTFDFSDNQLLIDALSLINFSIEIHSPVRVAVKTGLAVCLAVVCLCFFYLDLLQNDAIVTS